MSNEARQGGKAMGPKKVSAFENSRLLACGSKCDNCGELKTFPEGLGLYESPGEHQWLCEKCYPEPDEEDSEEE
jgi:hypothetical protein